MNLNQSTMNQGQQPPTDQLKDIPPQPTTLTSSTSTDSKSYQSSRRSSTSSSNSNLTIRTLDNETINEIKRMLTNSHYDMDGTLDDDTIDGIKMMMPIIHHPLPPAEYDSRDDSDMSSLHTDHDDGSSCMQCQLQKG